MHPNIMINYTRSDGKRVCATDAAVQWAEQVLASPKKNDSRASRQWGCSVSTFALRSSESFGIGDLGDLRKCMTILRELGAQFCAINPLGYWSSRNPYEHYPYAPGSRLLVDPVHVSLTSAGITPTDVVPGSWQEARRKKIDLLRQHVVNNPSILHQDGFRKWASEETTRAQRQALYMLEHRIVDDGRNREQINYTTDEEILAAGLGPSWWIQYEAERQLAEARMVMPLYGDLPAGVAKPGVDAEMWSESILTGAYLGAPSDADHLKPQVWAIHGWDPRGLARSSYLAYRQTLEANLKLYSGLRIDHALSLGRQYIVPVGGKVCDGVYVRSDVSALTEILASYVGDGGCPYIYLELIGTPFAEVEEFVSYHKFPRYRLLLSDLEQQVNREDLVSITNHDTPTLKGLWTHQDISMQHSLGFYGDDVSQHELLARTKEQAGCPSTFSDYQSALYERLANCAADRIAVHLEDMLGMSYRLHYPGHAKGPDYQMPHPYSIEAWSRNGRVRELCETVSCGRRR